MIVFDVEKNRVIFQNECALDLFKGEDDFKTLFKLLIPDLEIFQSAHKTYSPEPISYDNKILGYSVYKVSEQFFSVYLRDITEKVQLESIAEAVNTMNNIGYVFSGIRHEIGNPVNSIKMTMSVLKNNIDKYKKETIVDYVDRTLYEINRIEYILKTLKTFNMFEHPEILHVHVPAFLERFLALTKNDFEDSGISIEAEIHPDVEWAYTDPRALHQVLLNIMSNASDALKDQPNPSVSIQLRPVRNRILISIKDNGCGMTQEQQKNLFKPFVTHKPYGTGLGLVIARKTLAKMNSSISIKSEEDVGTTVDILIPRKEIEAA